MELAGNGFPHAEFILARMSEATFCTFVRHGQSLSNVGGVTVAHHAIPLTETGHAQARRLAELLPPAPLVLASPFERALHTARPWCERHGMAAQTQAALREFETIDPALVAGMTGAECRPVADAYWARADVNERMGERAETFAEFAARVQDFRARQMPALPAGTLVFGHGMWMAMLMWQCMGFSWGDAQAMRAFRRFQLGLPVPNGAAYVFTRVLARAGSGWHAQAQEGVLREMTALAQEASPASAPAIGG